VGNDRYVVETLRIDPDFFAAYGVAPLAGRVFSMDRPGDFEAEVRQSATGERSLDANAQQSIVINQAFAAKLGAVRPQDALGKTLWKTWEKRVIPTTVIGVVPDLQLRSVRDAIAPLAYYGRPPGRPFDRVTVNVMPGRMGEVTPAVGRLWKQLAPAVPIRTHFVADDLSAQYDADAQRSQIFLAFAAFAVLIACLGLFGLASFSAGRRTREIGLRKVLGASVFDIVRLLVGQFSRPVVLANLFAWPVSYLVMRRWLAGFRYAIDLSSPVLLIGMFGGAGVVALAIAWLTTAGHAYKVARANPGGALRRD
jgi:putative ABC transport system permease protein